MKNVIVKMYLVKMKYGLVDYWIIKELRKLM